MNFEQFTEKAKEVIHLAQNILLEYHHNQLDVEHILLALVKQPEGITGQILERCQVSPETIQNELETSLEKRPSVYFQASTEAQIYITPRAKSVLDGAVEEAKRLKDSYVGVEHLLIAVAKEESGLSNKILKKYKVDVEKIYRALQEIRGKRKVDDPYACLLYTSDAADDLLCLALGGRRIIKKKNKLFSFSQLSYISHKLTLVLVTKLLV